MGAHNIQVELKGKLNEIEIKEAFKNQVERDRERNSQPDCYSGDFQTVDEVKPILEKVFEDYDSAHDFCLDNSEKWYFVVAVHYKEKNDSDSINTLIAGWGAC